MLILTRRIGETVRINDDIQCTILGIKGNQIRLGFDAPAEVIIHREEIYLKIQQQKSALSNVMSDEGLTRSFRPGGVPKSFIH